MDQKKKRAKPKTARKATRRVERKKAQPCWWALPVIAVSLCALFFIGYVGWNEMKYYAFYRNMRDVIDTDTYYTGVSVDLVEMGGLTKSEALERFAAEEAQNRENFRVTLALDNQTWSLDSADMGYQSDYEDVLEKAYAVARYGTLESRYTTLNAVISDQDDRHFDIRRGAEKDVLGATLNKLTDGLSEEASNAKITGFDTKALTFTYTEAKPGYAVDVDQLMDDIMNAAGEGGGLITVERKLVEAERTEELLSTIYGKISSSSTSASGSPDNRLTNIRTACKTLNGMCIMPGETFSMNGTIGKRTKAKGYKVAGALENGLHTSQVGGGICQVSSTLFNAAAKAGMEIIERHPHSRPSSYIDVGKDAAVNWPNQDFKFKNTTNYPVYIVAALTNKERVIVQIYGKLFENGESYKIEAKKNSTFNPGKTQVIRDKTLAPGEKVVVDEARKGYTATTYRILVDKDDKEISREVLFKSYYAPAGKLVRVGV